MSVSFSIPKSDLNGSLKPWDSHDSCIIFLKKSQGCGLDFDLNDTGRAQAQKLNSSAILPENALVYSSPLKRAMQTAKIATGTTELAIDSRLTDRNFGLRIDPNRPPYLIGVHI